MPPGENGQGKASGAPKERGHMALVKSASAPAALQTPHPLARQMATREFDYDPISLKEPEDLHSWNWVGWPSRFINFLLHKSVQEVDGRDQHCALLFWTLIVLGFFAYGAFLVAGPIEQRKNPPQSFELLEDRSDFGPISHLPYLVFCPQLNWTKFKPSLGAVVHLRVSSRGWVTQDPARVDHKGIHRAAVEDYAMAPLEHSPCVDDGCYYFDGPTYSKHPDESVPLETRWISFLAIIRVPEAKKDDWSVMGIPTYATTDSPAQKCQTASNVTTMAVVPLTHRLPDRREFGIERIRLKLTRNIKLKTRYHVFPKDSTVPENIFDLEHVGSDTAHKASNETLEKEEPGYDTFAGAMSFRIAPQIYKYTELEPVNILAILCAIGGCNTMLQLLLQVDGDPTFRRTDLLCPLIMLMLTCLGLNAAGIWTAFVLSFKILFPSDGGRRRRVIRALRPWVSRIMPRKKSEAMQSLVRVLPPDKFKDCGHDPLLGPQGAAGEDADAEAKSTEEGRVGRGAQEEECKDAAQPQDEHEVQEGLKVPRLPPLFPRGKGLSSYLWRGWGGQAATSRRSVPDERHNNKTVLEGASNKRTGK